MLAGRTPSRSSFQTHFDVDDLIFEDHLLSKIYTFWDRKSQALRFVCEQVVDRCIAEHLVAAPASVGVSIRKADASRQKLINRDDDG